MRGDRARPSGSSHCGRLREIQRANNNPAGANAHRTTSTVSSIFGWMPQNTRYEPVFGKVISTVSPLRAGVEIELRIEHADVVGARIVVEDPELVRQADA